MADLADTPLAWMMMTLSHLDKSCANSCFSRGLFYPNIKEKFFMSAEAYPRDFLYP